MFRNNLPSHDALETIQIDDMESCLSSVFSAALMVLSQEGKSLLSQELRGHCRQLSYKVINETYSMADILLLCGVAPLSGQGWRVRDREDMKNDMPWKILHSRGTQG